MNKVIFLDIDGVLVCLRAFAAAGGIRRQRPNTFIDTFCPVSMNLINEVCELTGAKIVVSSSWRVLHDDVKAILISKGLKEEYFYPESWETPNIKFNRIRGDEVKQWLEWHPEVTTYAIFDDNTDFYPAQKKRLVKSTWEEGFLWVHYQKALKLLGKIINEDEPKTETEAA